ncbi:hypothetical protein [Bradyrhizobium genosp. A]|uniref:hypothetical protein n=1 Tax=Bradyrhizobium genosp. A TaxID=83626 RepID=UPI003CFA4D38
MKTIYVPCRPSFELGQIVATPGALEMTTNAQRLECLKRHSIGDWGCVCGTDWQANDEAVKDGDRILSAIRSILRSRAGASATIRFGSSPRPTGASPLSCCPTSIDHLPPLAAMRSGRRIFCKDPRGGRFRRGCVRWRSRTRRCHLGEPTGPI